MGKLKVLLTNAPALIMDEFDKEYNKIRGYVLYPPIALATIAACALKFANDIEVHILDLDFEIRRFFSNNPESKLSANEAMKVFLVDKLKNFCPDLVGISVIYSIAHSTASSIAKIVKSVNPKTTVVCGGDHATFAYKNMLEESPNIDFVFLKEADLTFPKFLEYLKGEIKFTDLKGIAYLDKDKKETALTPEADPIVDLDQLPIPKWDLVPIKEYQYYGRIGTVYIVGDVDKPTYTMQTSRGCLGSCLFCTTRSFYGRGVRAYSPKRVLDEIDYLYNELGITQFEILDDDFTFDRARAIRICDGIIERKYKVSWYLENGIRLGTINEEVMKKLVAAGCRSMSLGIESGNDSTLKTIHKPLSIKMLYEKMAIVNKYPEMYTKGNFMIGFPFENGEQTVNTFRVAEELGLDWCLFSVFHCLPGSPFFKNLSKEEQEKFNFDLLKFDKFLSHDKVIAMNHSELNELAYLKNLELNFIKNINFHTRNLERAIRDFEGITTYIARDHAIAYYCLAKAYDKKGNKDTARKNFKKAVEIISDKKNQKWINYFDKLVPKKEFKELKNKLEA